MKDPAFHQRLLATFRGEARDQWRALESGLFELAKAADDAARQAVVETIFRDAHTLKGAARLVGEHEAEAICQSLEGVFAELKRERRAPTGGDLEWLHAKVRELQRVLGLGGETPSAAETAKPEAAAAPAADTAGAASLVRVPTARLDELMLQAEELLAVKTSAARRTATLAEIGARTAEWKKRWVKLKPRLAAARRLIDQDRTSPASRQLQELLQFLEWNDEFVRDVNAELAAVEQLAGREQGWVGGLIDGLLDGAKAILMSPCASLLEVFPGFVREAARSQGKEIEVVLNGAETEVDRRVLEEIRDAVVHLVRNSVDHGIETPSERMRAGKPAHGTLTLGATEKAGGNVEITVSDDGRGADVERIRATAVQRGLVTAEAAAELPEPDVLALLFESGFSTRSAVSELSGRGLGLAIVKEKVARLGGSVSLETKAGGGTTFRLLVPITLARFRGVFVTAGGRPYVIPSAYVRQIRRVRKGDVRRLKNQDTIAVEGEPVPLVPLADVLRIPAAAKRGGAGATTFVVVVSAGRTNLACEVEDIPHESEIVMKSLGRLLPRVRHLAGATIAGAGQIVPVLNAGDLLQANVERRGGRRANPALRAKEAQRKRRVLIAEDSITSRSLFKSILQNAGYEVRTAVDGAEAVGVLKTEPVDLVISDVQMPRMDGFELTRKIRADRALSTLPVILITSLASREDKERGVDAGANAYLVKSSFDQSDLLQTIRRLLG